ncbi:MAG: apolipoprotein N-acyltransferase [Treponema sp.]|uniref:apolipoprotein N-acyltransferase n=1 Tax=Treponema sp. TaxID=166 RepID=UPI0025EF8733|nr:apolipoprotein N-acyltransferase [Treponema sp.]MBQ9281374.1 apolipoprotein N-acyltransferase [Treponema sp.]
MSRFLQIFCTVLSSITIALAIPNEYIRFGSPLLGLIALAPFYVALRNPKKLSFTFLLCFIHGALTHILSSFWLGNFPGFAIFTLGASDLGTGFFEGFFSLAFFFPALFDASWGNLEASAIKRHFSVPFRIFFFAAVYTIWEYCKSTGFLAYPWGTISMTAYDWKLVTQIADITGVYGVTFLFSLFSATFAEGVMLLGEIKGSAFGKEFSQSYRLVFRTLVALFSVTVIYGACRLLEERHPVKTMGTILVQQNSNPTRKDEEKNILHAQKITQDKFEEVVKGGEKCDLVVWSEAVLSRRFPQAETYYTYYPSAESLVSFIKKNKTPFVIGGPVIFNDEKHEYGNSALLFDKNGKFSGSYTKMHLVPFAELIPLHQYEPVRKIIKRMIGFSYGWTPGKKPVLFEIPLSTPAKKTGEYEVISLADRNAKKQDDTVLISTPICFDDSAHEVCHALYKCGSEIFVNITNDSWSKTDSSEIQHFVVAHYRSIEYRTTTIRSANAGYTVVIDPTGKILADLPLFEEGALFYKVPIFKRTMTVYARYGDWLPWSLMLLVFAYIFFAAREMLRYEADTDRFTVTLLPHTIQWYERFESVMSAYDEIFAIDWNKWNM